MGHALLTLGALCLATACWKGKEAPTNDALTLATVYADDTAAAEVLDVAHIPGGWVTLNTGGTPLTIYDSATAAPVEWIGRRGQGPDDLTGARNFTAHVIRDSVLVWDVAKRRIIAVSLRSGVSRGGPVFAATTDGSYTTSLREVSPATPLRLVQAGSGYLFQAQAGIAARSSDLLSMALLGGNSTSGYDTIFAPASGHVESAATELVSVPLWRECGDSLVVVFEPRGSSVQWYSISGAMRASRKLLHQRPSLNDRYILDYMREVLRAEGRRHGKADLSESELDRLAAQAARQVKQLFPDSLPAVAGLFCDDHGRALLNVFNPDKLPLGRGPLWIRISEQGVVDSLRVPARFQPLLVWDRRAVGMLTDSTGLEHLATVVLPN
jgi:hypothetical protein